MGWKKYVMIIILFFSTSIINGCSVNTDKIEYDYNDISNVVIRFHVLANSDSEEDQELKLKVRDSVINYLYPYMKDTKSIEESRKIINEKSEDILKVANKVITENGYDYKVEGKLSRENFPVKEYGNMIFPQGNYEAYRIIIGNGEGHNWWCVMFPPLCFVDETKENIDSNKNNDMINEYLEDDEEVEVKFKVIEWIKSLF